MIVVSIKPQHHDPYKDVKIFLEKEKTMGYKTIYQIHQEIKINIDQCIHKGIYRGIARCYEIGVFDKEKHCFYGIGFSCGSNYIETEYHYDFDPEIGTFLPTEFIELYGGNLENRDELKKFLNENLNRLKEQEGYHNK